MNKVTTNHDTFADAKQELFEKIKAHIDMNRIRKICADLYGITQVDALEYQSGDLVVHNGQVTYKLDFKVSLVLPLLIDEKGDFIGVQSLQTPQAETPEARVDEIAEQAGEITRQF